MHDPVHDVFLWAGEKAIFKVYTCAKVVVIVLISCGDEMRRIGNTAHGRLAFKRGTE
jgi:hypothetical protein